MIGYEYPKTKHVRRHGPEGYKTYESHREWLRDEFTYRCVYCLHREKWYGRSTTFHIEHSVPVDEDRSSECLYTNLLYSCATCNNAKRNVLRVPDPCKVSFGDCLEVKTDGKVKALNKPGRKLVEVLLMNRPKNVVYRQRIIRTLRRLKAEDKELFEDYMGFPENLKDLRALRVKGNSKPEGAENCYFVQRELGTLPVVYI